MQIHAWKYDIIQIEIHEIQIQTGEIQIRIGEIKMQPQEKIGRAVQPNTKAIPAYANSCMEI